MAVLRARMHGSQRLLCPVYKKLWSACEAPSVHPWVSREPLPLYARLSNTPLSPTWAGSCHPQKEDWAGGGGGGVAQWPSVPENPHPSIATRKVQVPASQTLKQLVIYSW